MLIILQRYNYNIKYKFENIIMCEGFNESPPEQRSSFSNLHKVNVYSHSKTTECVLTAVYQQ